MIVAARPQPGELVLQRLPQQALRLALLVVAGTQRAVEAAGEVEAPELLRRKEIELQLQFAPVQHALAAVHLRTGLVVLNEGLSSRAPVDPVDLPVNRSRPDLKRGLLGVREAEARLGQLGDRNERRRSVGFVGEEGEHQALDAMKRGGGVRALPGQERGTEFLGELMSSLHPDGQRVGRRPALQRGRLRVEPLENPVGDLPRRERLLVRADPPGAELVIDEPPVGTDRELLERRRAEHLLLGHLRQHRLELQGAWAPTLLGDALTCRLETHGDSGLDVLRSADLEAPRRLGSGQLGRGWRARRSKDGARWPPPARLCGQRLVALLRVGWELRGEQVAYLVDERRARRRPTLVVGAPPRKPELLLG